MIPLFLGSAKYEIVDNIHPEDGSVSELRKTVDDYIREIDKCIAHLSR